MNNRVDIARQYHKEIMAYRWWMLSSSIGCIIMFLFIKSYNRVGIHTLIALGIAITGYITVVMLRKIWWGACIPIVTGVLLWRFGIMPTYIIAIGVTISIGHCLSHKGVLIE